MAIVAVLMVVLAFAPAPQRESVSKPQGRHPQIADETRVAIERAPISAPRPQIVIFPFGPPCWLNGRPCRGASVASCDP